MPFYLSSFVLWSAMTCCAIRPSLPSPAADASCGAPVECANSTPAALTYSPGQEVPDHVWQQQGAAVFFSVSELPDSIFRIMQGKSYKANCGIPRTDLRYVRCLHRTAEGKAVVGELVVNKRIAQTVADIFLQLFENGYPIERMRLVDYWDAEDERSMRANNTSAFNFRYISHTRKISKHGLGLAIDINPLYNPYYKKLPGGKSVCEPSTATRYLDRSRRFPYKIIPGDLCHRLFTQHGFRWGGSWKNSKDYQHFEWAGN